MPRRTTRLWSKDEIVVVLSLYCQIPFGKMHSTSPLVISTAESLGRSPSSVAMKLVNLASLDPYHQARGVSGMRNVSKLDREVWGDYYGCWEMLSDAYSISVRTSDQVDQSVVVTTAIATDFQTEAIETRTSRRGQSFFRNAVLAAYDLSCCLTGIHCPELLRASHIVPWSISTENRLNPSNGLCLNSLHDAAFDRGLIALTDECRVVLSSRLLNQMPQAAFAEYFERYDGISIRLPDRFIPDPEHLAYHRKHVFEH